MVNALQQRQLSVHLRQLVTGRATNDQFDEWYAEYEKSEDRAVREIAAFGYALYSSDLLWPCRLRGFHAVDQETRRATARCVLFLRSDREYEWPPRPNSVVSRCLKGAAFFLGMPLGITLLLCTLALIPSNDYYLAGDLAAVGALTLFGSVWLTWFWAPYTAGWRAWCESGDYDAWPFLRAGDFDLARGEKGS